MGIFKAISEKSRLSLAYKQCCKKKVENVYPEKSDLTVACDSTSEILVGRQEESHKFNTSLVNQHSEF